MHSLLKPESRDGLWHRVRSLRPDASARWGKFSAPQMLAHLIQSLRMTSGDLAIPPEPVPWILSHAPLKQLLIYVIPIPKGMSTFRELLARGAVATGAWEAEQQVFRQALETVGAKDPSQKWPDHGAFGPMTPRQWGVLQYRHLDHHLKQFGV